MEKRLIFVTSPPACGKTKLSRKLATELHHVVYLDKDTLIPLSKQIFAVAGEEYNRSSKFFEKEIRDYEYEVILDLAFEALRYDNLVMVNAPFTREIRDDEYIRNNPTDMALKDCKLAHNYQRPKRHALTIPEQTAFIEYIKNDPKFRHWLPLFTFFLGTESVCPGV